MPTALSDGRRMEFLRTTVCPWRRTTADAASRLQNELHHRVDGLELTSQVLRAMRIPRLPLSTEILPTGRAKLYKSERPAGLRFRSMPCWTARESDIEWLGLGWAGRTVSVISPPVHPNWNGVAPMPSRLVLLPLLAIPERLYFPLLRNANLHRLSVSRTPASLPDKNQSVTSCRRTSYRRRSSYTRQRLYRFQISQCTCPDLPT